LRPVRGSPVQLTPLHQSPALQISYSPLVKEPKNALDNSHHRPHHPRRHGHLRPRALLALKRRPENGTKLEPAEVLAHEAVAFTAAFHGNEVHLEMRRARGGESLRSGGAGGQAGHG